MFQELYKLLAIKNCHHHHHHRHYHHISVIQLGRLLTLSGLTYPEVSSKVYHDSFCQLARSVSRHNRNQTFKKKNQQLSTLLFTDDQAVTEDTEDNPQKVARKLLQITTEHGRAIAVQKTKSMPFNLQTPNVNYS